jgi:type II secretory pathway pseudopilin PulG
MGLFKSSGRKKPNESGMTLLQGLLILAIIGIAAYVLLTLLAG